VAGAQVVAHENLKTNLATYNPQQGKPAAPNVTYAKDHVVRLGGAEVRAHYYGRAHTSGDTVVYFPADRVVSLGDSFVAATPNCDYPFGGSVVSWQKWLESVLQLDFDTAIPGHGNDPLTKDEVRGFKIKLDTIVSRASELVKRGTPKDQLIAQLRTGDIGWNLDSPQWTQPARLDPFFEEISKLP
jgi:glyoxylase-like metal-dependent hydrolase (beta-lactamase superfamily II)